MKAKILFVVIWLFIIGSAAMFYRWWVAPIKDANNKNVLINNTSSDAHYQEHVTINLDSFSAYSIFRSPEFRAELADSGLGLNLIDDGADYTRRLKDLQSGESQFAVFTIDAFIKASVELGDIPGVIIFIIDESRGADGAIGASKILKNVDALNDKTTKFVVVPNSPSETLARVIMYYFNLNLLEPEPFVYVNDAQELKKMYLKHKPTDKHVFVTWEPQITKMSHNPDYKIIVDSSKFRGYIVDVLIVNRDYLAKNPQRVQQITEAYFRTLFRYQQKLPQLLTDDSIQVGDPLKLEEADNIAKKIWFKNTRENYAHFGIGENTKIQHIEDIINNIIRVLIKTGSIDSDPTNGKPNILYFDHILENMNVSNFFPGNFGDNETIREDHLMALSDDDWKLLEPVGTLEVDQLVFARGSATFTSNSKIILDELVKSLEDTPQFYLMVTGNAGKAGNLQANKELAKQRAISVKDYLVKAGISKERIRAVSGEPSGETTVKFIVGQMPY